MRPLRVARYLLVALLFAPSPGLAAPARQKPAAKSPAQGEATALELLQSSKDALRRETAALVLGRARVKHALPALLLRLRRDENRWVRAACAEALGQIGELQAVEGLRLALGRENDQRVRRFVGEALLRLGHKAGVLELMWQLRAGSRHDRAEAMRALVRATGQSLGQDIKAWWTYLARRGYRRLATRPRGSPATLQLSGGRTQMALPKGAVRRHICVATLHLESAAKQRGNSESPKLDAQTPAAEGCFLLLATHGLTGADKAVFPGLDAEQLQRLLTRFPKLEGVGIDRPTIAAPTAAAAVDKLLRDKKLELLVGLKNLHLLPGSVTPVMAVRTQGSAVLLLALLP